MKLLWIAAILGSLTAWADAPTVVEQWGGRHIGLSVLSDDRASLSFDCASGSSGNWAAGMDRIDAYGTYTPFQPGPQHPGHTPKPQIARYIATVDGDEMKLTVKRAGQEPLQFELRRGAMPQLMHCL